MRRALGVWSTQTELDFIREWSQFCALLADATGLTAGNEEFYLRLDDRLAIALSTGFEARHDAIHRPDVYHHFATKIARWLPLLQILEMFYSDYLPPVIVSKCSGKATMARSTTCDNQSRIS